MCGRVSETVVGLVVGVVPSLDKTSESERRTEENVVPCTWFGDADGPFDGREVGVAPCLTHSGSIKWIQPGRHEHWTLEIRDQPSRQRCDRRIEYKFVAPLGPLRPGCDNKAAFTAAVHAPTDTGHRIPQGYQ